MRLGRFRCGHWWLEAGHVLAVELFVRPQGASWSIRLQPVLFRCGCTQHALRVPRGGRFEVWFVSSKLPRVSCFLIRRVTRHCVHLFGVQRENPSPKNSATTSFGRFYPNGLEGSKNGYCGLYVRTVSCKPGIQGIQGLRPFVAFDRSPGGKYSLNLTLSVGSATRVQTLREGSTGKKGVKNLVWFLYVSCICSTVLLAGKGWLAASRKCVCVCVSSMCFLFF